jgi:diacylglycerol kinase family enzyme
MRHLFIINPAAKKTRGKTKKIRETIADFFDKRPDIEHDIHETKRCRDSILFIRRYLSQWRDTVRIHAVGGVGTLFEVINSVIGYPNVEIASYPFGNSNCFVKYFGEKAFPLFASYEKQIFGKAHAVDIIRCGNNYGTSFGMAGMEAHANALGDNWISKGMHVDSAYLLAGIYQLLRGKAAQNYFINIDDHEIEGNFISILVANAPCYGKSMKPAIDAHPDDGLLNVYTIKNAPLAKLMVSIPLYTSGNYRKISELVTHYKARKIKLSSKSTMCMNVDGEHFYGTSIEYEVIPKAINFVCPKEIDWDKLPQLYGKPKEGLRSDILR